MPEDQNNFDILIYVRKHLFQILSITGLIAIFIVLFFTVFSTPQITSEAAVISANIRAVEITSTPYPSEFVENRNQTTGIVIGGGLVVLIVVFGTLGTISRSRRGK